MACSKDQLLMNQLELEEELSCSICLELYTDPVSLPCQHNFCRKCIHSHLQQKSDVHVHVLGGQPRRFLCPNCRESVELTDAKINNLPKNFALQNIILKIQSVKLENDKEDVAVEETNCKHHNKPLVMYCNTCEEAMCIECIPIRSHKNHNIVFFKDKTKMYKKEVEQTVLPQVIKLQESLREMKNGLTSSKQEVKGSLQINWKEVADSFQELRSAMNQKESEFMSSFESQKEKLDECYKTHTDSVEVQLDTLENLNTKFSIMSFQDPAKAIEEIKLDKERCEKASRDESITSEKLKQFLGDVKESEVSKQLLGLIDELKRIKSQINSMGIVTNRDGAGMLGGYTGVDRGAGRDDGVGYMVGETVEKAEDGAAEMLEQMASSAAEMHSVGQVHRGSYRDCVPYNRVFNKINARGRHHHMLKIVDPNTGEDISNKIYGLDMDADDSERHLSKKERRSYMKHVKKGRKQSSVDYSVV